MNNIPTDIKLTYLFTSILFLFFVGFIIFVIIVYRKRQRVYLKEKLLKEKEFEYEMLLKEIERNKAIQHERERISHDMHDDLGAGISAIKLHAEFLKNKINDPKYNQDFEDILRTSEEMNISMREILWSLNANNNKVGNFVEYCINFSDYFFRKHPIKIDYERKGLNLDIDLGNEKRRNLFLCFKESIHNVYKHSEGSTLRIIFEQIDDKLTITIQDNGKGIGQQSSGGNGLHNMKKRMEDIHGSFAVHNSKTGVAVVFSTVLSV